MNSYDPLKKIKIKKIQLAKYVFEIILMTFLSGGGSIRKPLLPLLIQEIIRIIKQKKKIDVEEKKIKRILDSLEKNELINISGNGDKIFVQMINNNHPKIVKYSIKMLLDFKKKKKNWNRKWFMVFFDVPEVQKNKREYLRKFLLQLGFYPYQKSVYLFPYECEKEISFIKKIVAGAKYMKYIIAEKIEDENQAKIFFNL